MTFAWPTALVGLALVPVLLGFYLWMQRQRRRYAVRFTNLALLREVVGRGPGMWRHIPPLLFLLGMAALLVSLARPSLVLAVPRDQASVMLVLDVSGSMDARDLQPTRLGAARQAAKKLVDGLPSGAQVGVVAFSDRATLSAPLSNDSSPAPPAASTTTPLTPANWNRSTPISAHRSSGSPNKLRSPPSRAAWAPYS